MSRQIAQFDIESPHDWKQKILHYIAEDAQGIFLDSNAQAHATSTDWDCLAACGVEADVYARAGNAFDRLEVLQAQSRDWLFGYLAYDLKNELEKLQSELPDGLGFPDLYFFRPKVVFALKNKVLRIESIKVEPEIIFKQLSAQEARALKPHHPVPLKARMPRSVYLENVASIKKHIIEGDVYEVNLCQEFYAESLELDPLYAFQALNTLSRSPYAAYLRLDDKYLICASPERFVQKKGQMLLSQPIKGTRRRAVDPVEDQKMREDLANSRKDRAENVMIVDLVRNDLARCCEAGSVQVPELFGIYSFERVHQMISTVTGKLRKEIGPVAALRHLFPMGSMTGAPKVMAMELIEQYEKSRRGLYSGAVGYFTPDGDFDFNVVIRSILYNSSRQYVSCAVGGAIVYDSDPQAEFEECLVKLEAARRVLGTDV